MNRALERRPTASAVCAFAVAAAVLIAPFSTSTALFAAALAALCVSSVVFESAVAPLGLHAGVWFSALGLSSLRLAPAFQSDWAASTWLVLVTSELALVCGCLFALVFGRPILRTLGPSSDVSRERYYAAALLFFVLGTGAFWAQVYALGGMRVLVTDPVRAREEFILPGFGLAYALLYIVPAMVVTGPKLQGWRRVGAIAVASASVLMTAVTIARFGMLLAVGSATLSVLYIGSFSLAYFRRAALLLAVAAAMFVLIGSLREAIGLVGKGTDDRIREGQVELPSYLALAVWPYLYVVGGFENFAYAFEQQPRTGAPVHVLRAVAGPLGLATELAENSEASGARLPYTRGNFLNTSPYLTDWYMDLGGIGTVVGPFVMGFALSLLFLFRRRSAALTVASALASYAFAMTFFSNYFTYPLIPMLLCCLVLVHLFSATKRHPSVPTEAT